MNPIVVDHLCKFYAVHQKEPGFIGSLRSFVKRRYAQVKAVDDVSFGITPGEVVGFLGPNGAGKTTTLKVLSGLLYPTRGRVEVLVADGAGLKFEDSAVHFLHASPFFLAMRSMMRRQPG